ncbi:MAG: hypothetical protein Q8O51_02375 [bacterium]|nr:hypothetical protein [bacterium]
MNIAILGNSTPDPVADVFAETLAERLSSPRPQEVSRNRTPRPHHKLVVTGSRSGIPEAVRRGAQRAPSRHVSIHYVEKLHADVESAWIQEGYYRFPHSSFVDRANFVSTTSAVIFFDINRANVGTALTLLHEQREDTAKILTHRPPRRILLFRDAIFHGRNSDPRLAELTHLFGRYVDASDLSHLKIFHNLEDAEELIDAFEATLQDLSSHI